MANGIIDIDSVTPSKTNATKFKLRRELYHKTILPIKSVEEIDLINQKS